LSWRIFYGDGSEFGSESGGPQDAPSAGALCIVQIAPTGPQLLAGYAPHIAADWYWRCDPDGRGECWWAGTLDAFVGQAMRLGARWPKQGQTVHNDTFDAILARAIAHKTELEQHG
jgi:hypothetical protein